MKIDAHNHPFWYYMTPDKMVANMDQYGIDKCWLLSCEIPWSEFGAPEHRGCQMFSSDKVNMPFENCLPYLDKYPDRFMLGYAPDPRQPYALEKLKYAMKAYDVKICGELKYRMMLDNPDAIRLYRFCGENGLPVIVHIQRSIPHNQKGEKQESYWYGGDIDALERALKLCPETNIIGHAQSFWSEISGDGQGETNLYPTGPVVAGGKLVELMEKYPNLYCDMSAISGCRALSRDLDFTKAFLTEYQDRVLYARDYVDNSHQELIESLGLSEEIKEKIYSGNALRLIGQN
ncbi:MAG: amidohydrolase family protein [Clostridia bacterium]|nr:amidohydrolase family protein [Clostridia bacterium]